MSNYYLMTDKVTNPRPNIRNKVVKIMSFEIRPSSLCIKKSEITGDMLNKVHPIPKGRD